MMKEKKMQTTTKSLQEKQQKKTSKPAKKEQPKKLTLAEKQAIKLKAQREREARNAGIEPKNKERFYCTSSELQAELIKWRDSAKKIEDRILSEELGRMLMAIADKMLNRSEFRNYSKELKEDAKGLFFVKAIKGLKNYNFEFNNPFAYFSTCAYNAYITTIVKHYKQQNIRKDVMKQLLSELETYQGIDPKSSLNNYIRQYINSDDGYVGGFNE